MLALGERIGRQHAHDTVYDAAQAAALDNADFRKLLASDSRVDEYLSDEEIETLLDPTRYVGLCRRIAEEQAERALRVAKTLAAYK